MTNWKKLAVSIVLTDIQVIEKVGHTPIYLHEVIKLLEEQAHIAFEAGRQDKEKEWRKTDYFLVGKEEGKKEQDSEWCAGICKGLERPYFVYNPKAGITKAMETVCKRVKKDTEEATARKILNRIETYFVDTVEPDGTIMHHIDDAEWNTKIKSHYPKQGQQEVKDNEWLLKKRL